MPSPILARADALMHRRRQGGGETAEPPVLTDAVDEDDIPLLLDIDDSPAATPTVDTAGMAETAPAPLDTQPVGPRSATASPSGDLPTDLPPDLLAELTQRVETHLHALLPGLIQRCLDELLAEQAEQPPTPQP